MAASMLLQDYFASCQHRQSLKDLASSEREKALEMQRDLSSARQPKQPAAHLKELPVASACSMMLKKANALENESLFHYQGNASLPHTTTDAELIISLKATPLDFDARNIFKAPVLLLTTVPSTHMPTRKLRSKLRLPSQPFAARTLGYNATFLQHKKEGRRFRAKLAAWRQRQAHLAASSKSVHFLDDAVPKYVQATDFNLMADARDASVRLAQLMREVRLDGERRADGTEENRTGARRSADEDMRLQEMLTGMQLVGDGEDGQDRQAPEKKGDQKSSTFAELLQEIQASGAAGGSASRFQRNCQDYPLGPTADSTRRTAQHQMRASVIIPPPAPLIIRQGPGLGSRQPSASAILNPDYTGPTSVSTVTLTPDNAFHAPELSLGAAASKIHGDLRVCRNYCIDWLQAPKQRLQDAAKRPFFQRDLHFFRYKIMHILQLLVAGREGWNLVDLPEEFFDDVEGLLQDLLRDLETLAVDGGCRWVDDVVVAPLLDMRGRLLALRAKRVEVYEMSKREYLEAHGQTLLD